MSGTGVRLRGMLVLASVVALVLVVPGMAFADPPPNDDFADAQPLDQSLPVIADGTTAESTVEAGEPMPIINLGGSVWFSWTAPLDFSRSLGVEICRPEGSASTFYGINAIYEGSSFDTMQFFGASFGSCGYMTVKPIPGATYSIQVGSEVGIAEEADAFTIGLSAVDSPANDDTANAQPVWGPPPVSVTGNNEYATVESPVELAATLNFGMTVWYRIEVADSGSLVLETCGNGFTPIAQVYDSSDPGGLAVFSRLTFSETYTQDCENGDHSGVLTAQDVVAGKQYLVSVDTWDYWGGGIYAAPFTLTFSGTAELVSAPPPVVSNAIRIRKVKPNRKKGTAKATLSLPGAGTVQLLGSKKIKAVRKSAARARNITLSVKPKGKLKKKLRKKGRAKVTLKFRFSPSGLGGSPRTVSKKVTLRRR